MSEASTLVSEPAAPAADWNTAAVRDVRQLAAARKMHATTGEKLARHTSMGVGGPCPLMVWPRRPDDVRELARFVSARGLGWRVIGGGTNLLVSDTGVDDLVINTCHLIGGARIGSERAFFPAGTPTARALRGTVERGLDGLVWASGLPGTIAGAAAGNAGCWGSDMARSVTSLDLVTADGEAHRIESASLGWSYRTLALPPDLRAPITIIGVTIALRESEPLELGRRYRELQETKRQRQPVGARNSGCVFRNPPGDRSAGMLIEQSDCKSLRVGGAAVSAVHANFIVNHGGSSAADVLELVDRMHARVLERFDVDLQTEIRQW